MSRIIRFEAWLYRGDRDHTDEESKDISQKMADLLADEKWNWVFSHEVKEASIPTVMKEMGGTRFDG